MSKLLLMSLAVILTAAFTLVGCDSGSNEKKITPEAAVPAGDQPATDVKMNGDGTAAPSEDTPVVASVNGVPISRQLFDSQVIMAEASQMIFGGDDEEDGQARESADLALRLEVLDGLIGLELACQEAVRRGYAPSADEVDTAIEKMRAESDDPDNFYKALDQYGESNEEMRNQLSKTMALRKWQENDFLAGMAVSEEEARRFYDANKESLEHGEMAEVSAIFVAVPLGSLTAQKDQARTKAEDALKRLRRGEDFGAVALAVSDAPNVAQNRGEMGWLEKERSMPIFDEAVFSLKPGELTDIIESPMGFHIFKINKLKPAGVDSFEEMRADIVEFLSGEKLNTSVREKMAELRRNGVIEIYDPKLKEGWEKAGAEVP